MNVRKIYILLVGVIVAGSASALTLSDNTGELVSGRVAVGEYGFGAGNPVMQARSFSTGLVDYYLDSIAFGPRLYYDGNSAGSGAINISVYSDSSSAPASAVTGGQNLFSATTATVGNEMTASSQIILQANTTYWFVASVDQSGGATRYWWDMTTSSAFNSDVTGTDLPLARANDAGGTWTSLGSESMHIAINGTAVPEPGTISLMGLGVGGVWIARMRRVRKSSRPDLQITSRKPSFLEEEHGRGLVGEGSNL